MKGVTALKGKRKFKKIKSSSELKVTRQKAYKRGDKNDQKKDK